MQASVSCLNSDLRPKKSYPSEAAAVRDLKRSPRWRRRATWPVPYWCTACGAYHVGRAEADL